MSRHQPFVGLEGSVRFPPVEDVGKVRFRRGRQQLLPTQNGRRRPGPEALLVMRTSQEPHHQRCTLIIVRFRLRFAR